MKRRASRMIRWLQSVGIIFLAVVIVGSILGAALFLTQNQALRFGHSVGSPARSLPPKASNPEFDGSAPTELSRKIAESFRRKSESAATKQATESGGNPEATGKLAESGVSEKPVADQSEKPSVPELPLTPGQNLNLPDTEAVGTNLTAAQILSELNKSKVKRTKGRSPRADQSDREREVHRRAGLIGRLYELDPGQPQLPRLLVERWLTLRDDRKAQGEREEASSRKVGDPVGDVAHYVAARLAVEDPAVNTESALRLIKAFSVRTKMRGPRISELLGTLADRKSDDPARRREIYEQIIDLFPDSRDSEVARQRLSQLDDEKFRDIVNSSNVAADPRIGKIFEFSFQDALSGELVTSEALRGRILLVDFWATWCPPCVASMPHLKELYAKYSPRGVIFIGVSHDSGDATGFQKLLNFVSEREIPWPQYLQKDRELSRLWNIEGIPTVFIVDKAGRIVSKGGNFDRILSQLLDEPTPRKRPKS